MILILLLMQLSLASGKTKILVLGDSLTEGYGLSVEKAFPSLLEKKLNAKGKNVEVINAGTSGATSASGPPRLKWYLKGKPDVLVLALGANDGLRGLDLDATERNLSDTVKAAKEKGLKVLLAGIKLPPNYGKAYAVRMDKMYAALAKQHSVPLLPFLLEGVGGIAKYNLPDGLHPNEAGYEIVSDLVMKHLLPLL